MIIMHARPRQTDRRTNIIAIARRFVLTNASRISRVNNEVSRSLLSKVRAWTGQTHRWTHTDGRNLTHYQLHYVPLHSVLYSITIIIKIGSSLTMQRYRDTEVEFCWRLDSSRNAALPSSPLGTVCRPGSIRRPTTAGAETLMANYCTRVSAMSACHRDYACCRCRRCWCWWRRMCLHRKLTCWPNTCL